MKTGITPIAKWFTLCLPFFQYLFFTANLPFLFQFRFAAANLRYRNDIDWTEWKNLCKKFDLLKFGYALSRVAERVCGISLPFDCKEDIGNENALLNDILKSECVIDGHSRLVRHYQIVRNILVSSWKFKMFSNTSSANYMWKRIKGFLFEKQ